MPPFFRSLPLLALLGLAACRQTPAPATTPETNPVVAEADWQVLFDGTNLDQWRGFKTDSLPSGWRIQDSTLFFDIDGGRGDLITREQFQDFELALEWKISEAGNSGIFFHVSEDRDYTWETGPEMQVLDDSAHFDGKDSTTSAGANYALHPPARRVVRPAGQWNEVRLVVDSTHVEHWLNGEKIVEYELWSDDWKARVAASKFKDMPGYGLAPTGHIALQDHGNQVWYRNIRIRPL
jgi:hypothetical protein